MTNLNIYKNYYKSFFIFLLLQRENYILKQTKQKKNKKKIYILIYSSLNLI